MKNFITFEGGEGSGKTTIIKMLCEDLEKEGIKTFKSREPGGSRISEEIRNIILNVQNIEMDYMTEALLYAASRRQHLEEIIKPALNSGALVICDRYVDASLAYQGYARNLGIEKVYDINLYATSGVLPELTIYIDIDPNVGINRIKNNHRDMDRLDLEQIEFHNKVRAGYLKLVEMFPDRIKKIDGNKTINEVYEQVKQLVFQRIKNGL